MKRYLVVAAALLLLSPMTPRLMAQQAPPPEETDSGIFLVGRQDGELAARERKATGWLGAGFLGGATLGPIGAGFAVALAGRGAEPPGEDPRLRDREPPYVQGFREGYRARVAADRRVAALVGGISGTMVLTFVLIRLMEGSSGGGSGGPPPAPGPTV